MLHEIALHLYMGVWLQLRLCYPVVVCAVAERAEIDIAFIVVSFSCFPLGIQAPRRQVLTALSLTVGPDLARKSKKVQ